MNQISEILKEDRFDFVSREDKEFIENFDRDIVLRLFFSGIEKHSTYIGKAPSIFAMFLWEIGETATIATMKKRGNVNSENPMFWRAKNLRNATGRHSGSIILPLKS